MPICVCAQSGVEQATRETDILSRQEGIQEKLLTPPREPPRPKIKEKAPAETEEKFFIKKINLVGCEYISCGDFSSIAAKYENKEITLSDLETLAKEIEREYLRKGVIAAVFVPEQEVQDETVTLQVVEARMGELKIRESKYFNSANLRRYWKVPPDTIMRYDLISKSIQMMNKNPDREVKAALAAGKKPRTTDVILTPETQFPVHGTYSFDREGITTTGRNRVGYGLRHNNFLGLGDTLLSGYNFGRSFDGIFFYHTVPVNYEGTSILYGYSRSESKPLKDFVTTGLKSEAVNASFSLRQDLYRRDEYIGEAYFSFDAKDKIIKANSGPINRDRLRILSLGANLVRRRIGNTTTVSPAVSQGVSAFGATGHNNPLASRGAYPVYTKLNLGIQHKRVLPFNLQGSLRVKGQLASRKLTPQEEFGLGGIDSVRGYPASDYLADNSVVTNTELLIPAFFVPPKLKLPLDTAPLREETVAVLFADYGWGKRRGALTSEKATKNLLGLGAGLRFNLYNQAFLRLEWGFPIGANNPLTEGGRSKFHFSVDFQDKLPEEIERIRKQNEEKSIKQAAWMLVDQELSRPGSRLGEKLYGYLHDARMNYELGNFEESKLVYAKIYDIGTSLYMQAEEYVRTSVAQEKKLRKDAKLATAAYKEGRLGESRMLWQKIIDDANIKPLVFEF